MGLQASGPCSCHIVYIYPKDVMNNGRCWFLALSTSNGNSIHNHSLPSEWKVSPKVLTDISNAVTQNTSFYPKNYKRVLE